MGEVRPKFKDIVDGNSVNEIRRELLGIINRNPDMQDGEFSEAIKYAEKKIGKNKLYEPFTNQIELIKDKKLWDEKYMAILSLHLRKEFSEKIVLHIQNVGPVAYREQCVKKKVSDCEKEVVNQLQYLKNQENTIAEEKYTISKEDPLKKAMSRNGQKSQEVKWVSWAIVIMMIIILGVIMLMSY